MNAIERKKQRIVKKYYDKWRKPLGLRWWKIDIFYFTDAETIKNEFTKDNGETTLFFRVWAHWEYLEATIGVNLPGLCAYSEEEIERFVVHELVHVLVNEMRETGIKHEERVVSTVTDAFFWVKEMVEKEARVAQAKVKKREVEYYELHTPQAAEASMDCYEDAAGEPIGE